MATKLIIAVLIFFGLVSLVFGIISLKWHCFLFAGMFMSLSWAWYHEEKENAN
jgi:hypothetical protein